MPGSVKRPSGPVTEDAFERISALILQGLKAAMPLDGVYLDLHGAMVTEHLDDGEGELLKRVRAFVCAFIHTCALNRSGGHGRRPARRRGS